MKWIAPGACLLIVLAGLALSSSSLAWNLRPVVAFSYGLNHPGTVQILDFDRDGRKDVVAVNQMGDGTVANFTRSVVLFRQLPNGSLAAPVALYREKPEGGSPFYFHGAYVTDLNGDGRMDMLVGENVFLVILLQKSDGTFTRTEHLQPSDFSAQGITRFVLYDADLDGVKDVIALNWADYMGVYLMNRNGTVRSMSQVLVPDGSGYVDVELGDIDHDGKEDLLYSVGGGWGPHFSVFGPDGKGSLKLRKQFSYTSLSPTSIAIGDFDNDGLQEIATARGTNAPSWVEIIKLDNALGINQIKSLSTYDIPYDLVAADVNGDGLDDLSLIHRGWNTLGHFIQSKGKLIPEVLTSAETWHWRSDAMAVGDINGDRCPDTVYGDNALLNIVYGTECDLSPLPTVDFGLELDSYMAVAYEEPELLYARQVLVTYEIKRGNEVPVDKPRIRIVMTALPGEELRVVATGSQWGACTSVEETPVRAEYLCTGTSWTTQHAGPQVFGLDLDPARGTRFDISARVETDSPVFDTNLVNQYRTARMDFLTGTGITAAARHIDYNGDAKSDLLWQDASTRGTIIWRGASNLDRQPVTTVADPQWAIRGTGDFDGDGNSDILWRHGVSGANTIWKTASSNDRQNLTGITNPDWQVAGIGDFNGDGKSDILWRNARTGGNAIWRSGDSNDYQAVTAVTGTAWKIAGIGDFDGDSRSDILWRNTTTGGNTIWKAGNFADKLNVTGVSNTDWVAAGVGDFDHDGKADILWRNETTGVNSIWKGADHTTQIGVVGVTGASWKIASVGDYDGDGNSDIFWRDVDTGKGAIWKSGSYASQQAVAAAPSPTWSLAP